MIRRFLLLLTSVFAALEAFGGAFRPLPPDAKGVPDIYIVVLSDAAVTRPGKARPNVPTVAELAQTLGRSHGGRVEEVWEHALPAFVVRMPEARARKLADDPRVLAVEQDFAMSAPVGDCYYGTAWSDSRTPGTTSPQTQTCSDPDPLNDTGSGAPACKDNWGIDRIDQTSWSRNNQFTYVNKGGTVHVYVLDTGIRWSHQEFLNASGTATRVSGGVDARQNPVVAGNATNTDDCYGHGTHVAGIIAGRTFGVAKEAMLHPVRTIGCPNDTSNFASRTARGINWIVANVQRPAVINWSGGNGTGNANSTTLRAAVQGIVDADIVLVQAAGNQSWDHDSSLTTRIKDACENSFGGEFPSVIVAGGIDHLDGRWTRRPGSDLDDAEYCTGGIGDCGSNAGACIDVWAPSAHVISSNATGDSLACRLSGTSMAAPHVTGVVAAFLQSNQNATVAQVERALRSRGTWGMLETSTASANYIGAGSDNVLVFSDTRSAGSDLAPFATYSVTCAGRTCTFDSSGTSDDNGLTSATWAWGDGSSATESISGTTYVRTGSHLFPANFSGRVTLGVTDSTGKTDHHSVKVTVNSDAPPTAAYTFSCVARTCTFDASGSTDDVGITSRTWNFGDGNTGSGTSVSHTYAASGNYTVVLTVSDAAPQTDDESKVVAVDFPAPTFAAATASGGSVTITWTPSAGADGYDIERKVSFAGGWVPAVTVMGATASSGIDTPGFSGVVLYRVIARAGTSRSSASNVDVAYTGTFTDDPILTVSPFTTIKAVHLVEVRQAVNALYALNGFAAVYTGTDLDAAHVRTLYIDDSHFTTLMTNLNGARAAAGIGATGFQVTPVPGGLVDDTQMANLRAGVK